jgi:hypothetical protein
MWWQPATAAEGTLKALMEDVQASFRDTEKRINGVHAIGTAIGRENQRVPLVYLDASFLPNRFRHQETLNHLAATLAAALRGGRELDRSPALPRCTLTDADSDIKILLDRWHLPKETIIAFTEAPRPLFDVSSLVWSPASQATIGMFLRIDGRLTATTAGHLVASSPCNILQRHSGFLGITQERIGSVQYFNDPKSNAGVDIAVIELSEQPEPPPVPMGQAAAGPLYAQTDVLLRGGVSGIRRGWVNGDALLATRAMDGRTWTNCWNINEYSGGFAQEGDSGGVVISYDNQVLGHLVGSAGTLKAHGRQCGLVQDVATTLTALRNKYQNSSIEVLVADWPRQGLIDKLRRYFRPTGP